MGAKMSCKELISEGWKIVRQNRPLWWVGIAVSLLGLPIKASSLFFHPEINSFLNCLLPVFLCLGAYGTFVMYSCAGVAAQRKECTLKEIWGALKSDNDLDFAFLAFLWLLYFFILLVLYIILWQLLTPLAFKNIDRLWFFIIIPNILMILFSAPIALSPYGLLFQKMGPFQSFVNGIKIFSTSKLNFVSISAIQSAPSWLAIVLVIVALAFTGHTVSYGNYTILRSAILFETITYLNAAVWFPITTTAFALGYFQLSPTRD
jgi:hypothetical protein